jgi:hypothetical protein
MEVQNQFQVQAQMKQSSRFGTLLGFITVARNSLILPPPQALVTFMDDRLQQWFQTFSESTEH